ncbi:hypothetical protein [Coxiella endosymbiont of Ornithodoros maritimus]|uniref:hypothetical protein n=1 Tax=Coxiella endosymbiont of Ornithodoros maritimus TaxID=1656172 RepID=UPI002264CE1A|nr:hypothetical protein [Coxiella endosymbiont of Ornithodoros maritimus]
MDIGCDLGLFSLVALLLKTDALIVTDVDPESVLMINKLLNKYSPSSNFLLRQLAFLI